jgi:hypothetical protein
MGRSKVSKGRRERGGRWRRVGGDSVIRMGKEKGGGGRRRKEEGGGRRRKEEKGGGRRK